MRMPEPHHLNLGKRLYAVIEGSCVLRPLGEGLRDVGWQLAQPIYFNLTRCDAYAKSPTGTQLQNRFRSP